MKTGATPVDPELAELLGRLPDGLAASLLPEEIPARRALVEPTMRLPSERIERMGIDHHEESVAAEDGHPIPVLVLRRTDLGAARGAARPPAVVFVHGGGMVMGDNRSGIMELLTWVRDLGVTGFSVGYRLAPEHPHPIPVGDVGAAVSWVHDRADRLGVDPERIVLVGTSAGGGLAAGASLKLRDDGRASVIRGLLLESPMLDDRGVTASSRTAADPMWDRTSHETAWRALLGHGRVADQYAAAARAEDLAGLPPTYVDVGSAELFRDEVVAYSGSLWCAGVPAELHVWPGAFHGSDSYAPRARLSRLAQDARRAFLTSLLDVASRPASTLAPVASGRTLSTI